MNRPTAPTRRRPCPPRPARATPGRLSAGALALAALLWPAVPASAQAPGAARTLAPAPAPAAPPPAAAAKPGALGCLIEASATVEVGTSVIGVLDAVLVERGAVVKRGQVLARLESGVERAALNVADTRVRNQADIQSARSQKDYAQKKATRTAELSQLKFISNQALEQAETEASLAEMKVHQTLEQQAVAAQELRLARAQLSQRTVYSPLSGVVVDRYASAGERIENRPILKLAQIDPLRVEVVLPSAQFNSIRPGMSASVLPDLPGTAAQTATVAIVDRVIDAASNTFRVRLDLPNKGLALPSGLRCKVAFDAAPAPAGVAAPADRSARFPPGPPPTAPRTAELRFPPGPPAAATRYAELRFPPAPPANATRVAELRFPPGPPAPVLAQAPAPAGLPANTTLRLAAARVTPAATLR